MTSDRTIEQRRDRPHEDVDDISWNRTPFNAGVLRASTPISTAESSFEDPLNHTFFETSDFNDYLKTHHCPRTYSRPKKPDSPVAQVSDCSIDLGDVGIESPQTLHNKAEKEGRFRNLKRVFSKSTPSPENKIVSEEEKLPSDWLLFQSPKKPERSELSGPSRKKARRVSVSASANKKYSRHRKQSTNKGRGIKNKMSKRRRLPVKVHRIYPQDPSMTPSVTGEQARPTRDVYKYYGFDDSD